MPRFWTYAPEGLYDSAQGFNPGNPHPKMGRPHKALLRCALGKNTRRARVGGAEGAKDDVGQIQPYCSKAGNDMSYFAKLQTLVGEDNMNQYFGK
jgi:hypothetical protein